MVVAINEEGKDDSMTNNTSSFSNEGAVALPRSRNIGYAASFRDHRSITTKRSREPFLPPLSGGMNMATSASQLPSNLESEASPIARYLPAPSVSLMRLMLAWESALPVDFSDAKICDVRISKMAQLAKHGTAASYYPPVKQDTKSVPWGI